MAISLPVWPFLAMLSLLSKHAGRQSYNNILLPCTSAGRCISPHCCRANTHASYITSVTVAMPTIFGVRARLSRAISAEP